MNDFIASRDLSPEDFEKFSEQCRRGFNHHRTKLNEYRRKAEEYAAMAQSSLQSLNRDKAHAMKHGVDLEPKKLRYDLWLRRSYMSAPTNVMIRAKDLSDAKNRALLLMKYRFPSVHPDEWHIECFSINGIRL